MCFVNPHIQNLQDHDGTFISDFNQEPAAADTSEDHVEYDGQLVTAAGLFVMKTRDGRKVTQVHMTLCAMRTILVCSPHHSYVLNYCMDPCGKICMQMVDFPKGVTPIGVVSRAAIGIKIIDYLKIALTTASFCP